MAQARVTRLGKASVRDAGVRGQPRKFPRLAQSSVRPWASWSMKNRTCSHAHPITMLTLHYFFPPHPCLWVLSSPLPG